MKHLWSIFTTDMDHCIFTGMSPVERHHIYSGSNRVNSEKYGYVAPLRPDLHPNGVMAGKYAKEVDLYLKTESQKHFEANIGNREEFRKIFGKSYL